LGQKGSWTWKYSFNASELLQQINFIASMDSGSYTSLYIKISETYQPNKQDNSWLTFTSPKTGNLSLSRSIGISSMRFVSRAGPCGIPILISPPHDLYISLFHEFQNQSSELIVDGTAIIELEDTLISSLPASSNFHSDGIWQFRTVKMDPPYENKDFWVTLSTPGGEVSDYINEVRFVTEDQCNSSPLAFFGENAIYKMIPPNSGSSYNVTVPAEEIWHIGFITTNSIAEINVDFKVVDRPDDSSPAFIPSLNLSVIVLLGQRAAHLKHS
jgi:hypothetical protein